MKKLTIAALMVVLSTPAFAAKWNQLTGDALKAAHEDTVITGNWKGTKYTTHYCADGRSFQKFGSGEIKARIVTYENDNELCVEDDNGKRCYHIFQNSKKPHKLKFKGTNNSNSGKNTLKDKSPDWCN